MITANPRSLAAVLGTLTLAACASPNTTPAPAPAPSPSSVEAVAAAAKPTQQLTAQGFLPKGVGELAGVECTTDIDSCTVKFTLDKVDNAPPCDKYGLGPDVGWKTVVLHVSLTTGALSEDAASIASLLFNPFALKGIGEDGSVHDVELGMCTANDDRLSNDIFPNSRYTGTVEVEVPEPVTSIATTYRGEDAHRGWVWRIDG